MTEKQIQSKIASIVRIVERMNKKIEALTKKYGTNELYLDKSSTCVGSPESISYFTIEFATPQMLRVSIEVGGKPDAWSMIPAFDEDGNLYYSGAYEFAHDLEWYRKCIRAAERFYQSEDPDRFLEHDGYEDK